MEPKIIALASSKGGVGKTTISLQLAIARARQKKEVWLIDGDRQQTAQTAITIRGSQNKHPFVACASYPEGKQLSAQVRHQRDKWDTIIIDVGGFDSTTLRASLGLCDLLLVPFQPRSFDVWGLTIMNQLLTETYQMRDPFPVYAFLNCADPKNSIDNQEAGEAVKDFPEIKFIDTPIIRRKAYPIASGAGLGINEMALKDAKAIAEFKKLMKAIFPDSDGI